MCTCASDATPRRNCRVLVNQFNSADHLASLASSVEEEEEEEEEEVGTDVLFGSVSGVVFGLRAKSTTAKEEASIPVGRELGETRTVAFSCRVRGGLSNSTPDGLLSPAARGVSWTVDGDKSFKDNVSDWWWCEVDKAGLVVGGRIGLGVAESRSSVANALCDDTNVPGDGEYFVPVPFAPVASDSVVAACICMFDACGIAWLIAGASTDVTNA